jgi:hypothetical protein
VDHTPEPLKLRLMCQKGDSVPRAAALRAWSLLFTSLGSPLSASEVEGVLADMADILEGSRNVDVRGAAGEVVAVLHSAYRVLNMEELDRINHDDNIYGALEGKSENGAMTEANNHSEHMESLVARMQDLAARNRGDALRMSKRNKAEQRLVLRYILGALEKGSFKAEKIRRICLA